MLPFARTTSRVALFAIVVVSSATVPVDAPGMPDGRQLSAAIYDPAGDRMIVFGGSSETSSHNNDIWALSLSGAMEWSQLTPAGTPPPVRWGHTAIHDPVGNRMIVFGGSGFSPTLRNDVWALSLGASPAWTQLTPSGTPPPGRRETSAIYDPLSHRMIVFGGEVSGGTQNDAWALSLSGSPSWTGLTTMGLRPMSRSGHTAVFDTARQRMTIFGGRDSNFVYRNDVAALTLTGSPTWITVSVPGPRPDSRFRHNSIYDPVADALVAFGGTGGIPHNDDSWQFRFTSATAGVWTEIEPAGVLPPKRWGSAGAFDSARRRLLVFGGYDFRDDAWALALSTPSWTELHAGSETSVASPAGPEPAVASASWGLPYPNPSTAEASIRFVLASDERVTVEVFDATGRRVRRLLDEVMAPGEHEAVFDGLDDGGLRLTPGLYLVRASTPDMTVIRKVARR